MSIFPVLSRNPSSISSKRIDDTITMETEGGYEYTRPRNTRTRVEYTLTYKRMTAADRAAVIAFLNTVANGGNSFSWINPTTPNYIGYSEALDNAGFWLNSSSAGLTTTVAADATIPSPIGTSSYKLVIPTTGAGQFSGIQQRVSNLADIGNFVGSLWNFSVWLKTDVASTVNITLAENSTPFRGGTITASMTTSWQRFNAAFTVPSDSIAVSLEADVRLGSSQTGRNVWAWGAQVESGTSMGTYTKTTSLTWPNTVRFTADGLPEFQYAGYDGGHRWDFVMKLRDV
jgi:hypothetical protein